MDNIFLIILMYKYLIKNANDQFFVIKICLLKIMALKNGSIQV